MQCGPAALAMVLTDAGVDTGPDRLAPLVYLPEREGSLQVELLGAVRRHGLVPYVIDPQPDSLFTQLVEGRPVLVLQDLGAGPFSRYHYAVVVGILPGKKIVLRSGSEKRLVMNEKRFLRSWQKAGAWGLVILQPGEFPLDADPDRYLREVASLENLGNWQAAEQGYRAVLSRRPMHLTALFGLGNVLLVKKEYSQAEKIFKKILEQQADNPAVLNNLAEALLRQGFLEEALTNIDKALAVDSVEPHLAQVLKQTREEILETFAPPPSRP